MIDPLALVATLVVLALLPSLCDEYLVASAVRLAEARGWSEGTAGSGLLAVSSSAPELMIALVSVLIGDGGHAGIGAATIVGSAVFNLLVIVGICAWIRRLCLPSGTLLRDCAFYGLGIAWLVWALHDGTPSWLELAVAVAIYALYASVIMRWSGGTPAEDREGRRAGRPPLWRLDRWLWRVLFRPLRAVVPRLVWAVILLGGLSWLLVDSAIRLAAGLGVPESALALTVLAVGTSVPDLLSSIAATRRGQGTIAVTNAVGSNIFDILPGLALPWLAGLAIAGAGSISVAREGIVRGAGILALSVVLLPALVMLGSRRGLGRVAGSLLLVLYGVYLGWELLAAT